MDETDKKIRELTEAMRAEQDARIHNRMMAVRGILAGYPIKDAAYFADVDQRTVQLWVARFDEGGIGGLRDAPGRGRASRTRYGLIRKLADRLGGWGGGLSCVHPLLHITRSWRISAFRCLRCYRTRA